MAARGNEATLGVAFGEVYAMLSRRIGLLVSLPIETLSRQSLREHVGAIWQQADVPKVTGP